MKLWKDWPEFLFWPKYLALVFSCRSILLIYYFYKKISRWEYLANSVLIFKDVIAQFKNSKPLGFYLSRL